MLFFTSVGFTEIPCKFCPLGDIEGFSISSVHRHCFRDKSTYKLNSNTLDINLTFHTVAIICLRGKNSTEQTKR